MRRMRSFGAVSAVLLGALVSPALANPLRPDLENTDTDLTVFTAVGGTPGGGILVGRVAPKDAARGAGGLVQTGTALGAGGTVNFCVIAPGRVEVVRWRGRLGEPDKVNRLPDRSRAALVQKSFATTTIEYRNGGVTQTFFGAPTAGCQAKVRYRDYQATEDVLGSANPGRWGEARGTLVCEEFALQAGVVDGAVRERLKALLGTKSDGTGLRREVVASAGSGPAAVPEACRVVARAYVANSLSDDVSVIDTETNTVVATIGVGGTPLGIAIAPDGSRAYVANTSGDDVSVIDTATSAVVATIAVGDQPRGIAVTPDGSRAYVTNFGDDTVSVIDTATSTVVATVGVAGEPVAVAITPDGARAYVANQGSDDVSVIDTATNTVVATVGVGDLPFGVAITPDGSRAYVTNFVDSTVSVIDTGTNTVVGTVAVGAQPRGVAIAPGGARAYVTNSFAATVSVIDVGTNMVIATVAVGNAPVAVAITPDGSRAYVTNQGPSTVSVIDLATDMVVDTVGVGTSPQSVAIR